MHPQLFARCGELSDEWRVEIEYLVRIFNERAMELSKLEDEMLRARLDARDREPRAF